MVSALIIKLTEFVSGEAYNFVLQKYHEKYGNTELLDRIRLLTDRLRFTNFDGESESVQRCVNDLNEFIVAKSQELFFHNILEEKTLKLEKVLVDLQLDLLFHKSFNVTRDNPSSTSYADASLLIRTIKEPLKLQTKLHGNDSSQAWKGTLGHMIVAVKIKNSSSEQDENFSREALILQLLNSRHFQGVVDFYGVDNAENPTKIVLEYGLCNLQEYLKKPQSLDTRVRILSDCSRIFENLVAHGILHRDIKPENVLIMHNLSVKIMNFGFVRARDIGLSMGITRRGTHSYLAPELLMQSEGVYEYSEYTDMYSFAVTMNQVLTNVVPFQNHSYGQLIGAMNKDGGLLRPDIVSEKAFPGNEGVSRLLASYITTCWSNFPSMRWTFKHLREQLKSLIPHIKKEGSTDESGKDTTSDNTSVASIESSVASIAL